MISHPQYPTAYTLSAYHAQYQRSLSDPQTFWADQAHTCVSWFKTWDTVLSGSFVEGNVRFFDGAELNVSYNCLDRHLATRGSHIALLWQGDDPSDVRKMTFAQLHADVARFGQALLNLGIQKGDRVCLYMPMIPEAVVAMLACARIGAIHSVVFGGFSALSLSDRINDASARILITADEGVRGGKKIPLKRQADEALLHCPSIEHMIVVQRTGHEVAWKASRDLWYHEMLVTTLTLAPPASMQAEDPLFILYTSGSTGQPKGIVHTTAGYLVYAVSTYRQVFHPQDHDVYWCTADLGWITGHTYLVYAPLAQGITTLMFEGVPTYPDASRLWEIVDQHCVTILYTAPTVLRTLMREGDASVKRCSRASLKLLGSVGEPINPEVWMWYERVVGDSRCPVVDTWWQTETGGIMMSPIPGLLPLKPGSSSSPLWGIQPILIQTKDETPLLIAYPWPGMARSVWGDHARFMETYFQAYPGYYCTGDGARCDEDGYYWITGRIDDVINVSGHRLGTADIENALLKHPNIAEAAVVGYPHPLKGQGIYAYLLAMHEDIVQETLIQELRAYVRAEIGAFALPDQIIWVKGLPKTRSGKVMRRLLRKIAEGDVDELGDLSTLADPAVVSSIVLAATLS